MKEVRKRTRSGAIPPSIRNMQAEAEKLHGEGVLSVGGRRPTVNHIPTGCFILDMALLGGLAEGYISMVYGYHSTHKTTNLLRTVANYQKKNPRKFVGWLDAEGMFDPLWAEQHGVNLDQIILASPDYGELGVDLFEDMMEREAIGMVIVDSIPHMVPHKMIENSAEDDTMGALARLMSKMASKITMANNRERRKGHWVTVILVNQFRTKIGQTFGDPRTLPGGVQINHIPTTKIELKKAKTVIGKDRYGNEIAEYDECSFKLDKVKHGQSLRTGEYQVYLNPDNEEGLVEGEIDNYSTIVTFAKKMGFVTGGGAKWVLHTINKTRLAEEGDEDRSFRKLDEIKQYLKQHDEEYESLAKSLIAEQRRIKGRPAIPPDGYLISKRARMVLPPSKEEEN